MIKHKVINRKELIGVRPKKRSGKRRERCTEHFDDIVGRLFLYEKYLDLLKEQNYIGCAECRKVYVRSYVNLLGFWDSFHSINSLGGIYIFGVSNFEVNRNDRSIDPRGTYRFLLYFLREEDLGREDSIRGLLTSLEKDLKEGNLDKLIEGLRAKSFELKEPVLPGDLIEKIGKQGELLY